jgi:DNA replication and repair protein RecF
MRILRAKVFNFRNLDPGELTFSPQVNLFLGRNGQGKTNLLEALNVLALGRSHRGGRSEDLIRLGAEHLHVSLMVWSEPGQEALFEYGLDRSGERRFKVGGQAIARRADLVGQLATVVFSPESVRVVCGGPEGRRRFVDQGLASLDRDYLRHLQACTRSLRQKTRLLKEARAVGADSRRIRGELEAWNRELACHAAPICRSRQDYANKVSPYCKTTYKDIAADSRDLQIAYKPRSHALKNNGQNPQLEQVILEELRYIVKDEIRRGRPLCGPHLDDFEIRLGGLDLRVFGSEGETRTAAVSLIMAQSHLCYQMRNVRPILFFDDIFSELDRERSRRLQDKAIADHQVFIATARDDDVTGWQPAGLRIWRVEAGRLESVA